MRQTRGALEAQAAEQGTTPTALVVQTVRETGSQKKAARVLKVSRSTIKHHMEKAGKTVVRTVSSVVISKETA